MSLQSSSAESANSTACPRCGKPLTDPMSLGWCPACGYCRSLEEGGNKETLKAQVRKSATKAKASNGILDVADKKIPWWILLSIVLIAGVLFGSFWMSKRLTPQTLPRALWSTIQIAAGMFAIFVGQFIALIRIAPEDPRLTFKDAIFPFSLWGHVLRKPSRCVISIVTASLGLSAVLGAAIFIRDLDHWFTYLPGGRNGRVVVKAGQF